MPINYLDLVRAAELVAEKEDLKVAAKYSLAAATTTAVTTFAGGIVLGPLGFVIGSVVGGVGSFLASKDKFKSVVVIIRELSPQQKERLAYHVRTAVQDFDVTDLIALASLGLNNDMMIKAVTVGIKTFLENDLKLQMA